MRFRPPSTEFTAQKPKIVHIVLYYFVPFVQLGLDKIFRLLWMKYVLFGKLRSPEIVIAYNLLPAYRVKGIIETRPFGSLLKPSASKTVKR